MNIITTEQKGDIEVMLNRYYHTNSHSHIISYFSKGSTSELEKLTLLQAKNLSQHLGFKAMQWAKITYLIALMFENKVWNIYGTSLTQANLNTLNLHASRMFNKKVFELSLDELEELTEPVERMEKARQSREKGKQNSADYYQATKATNQLLKSLSIPKEPPPSKQAKKNP